MLKIVYPICCGIDLHKKIVVATVGATNKSGVTSNQTKRFSTFTEDLYYLLNWLKSQSCIHVCMESTGIKPLLVQCANAVIKNKDFDYFRVRYQQIKRWCGHKKAIIAIAHMLLNCIYYILDRKKTFNYDLYKLDSKPKQTYAPQITEEMAVRYLQILGYQIPDLTSTA